VRSDWEGILSHNSVLFLDDNSARFRYRPGAWCRYTQSSTVSDKSCCFFASWFEVVSVWNELANFRGAIFIPLFTGSISGQDTQDTVIGRVRLPVCFHSRFWSTWPLTSIFGLYMGHGHSLPEVESQSHRLLVTVTVTVSNGRSGRDLWSRALCLVYINLCSPMWLN